MKKAVLGYVFLLGLLISSCVKPNNMRTTIDMFLKATTGIRKDVGTAD